MRSPTAGVRDNGPSFSVEITKYIPALRSLARLLTRNEESAADLTQETLAKAWAARDSFAAGTNLRAWLLTIMRNQFRSDMRRAWRQVSWDEDSAARIPAPRDEQAWSIDLKDAVRAIGALSKRQREAVILAGVGGFSNENVGAVTGCRTTAVKSRVCRARHAMRSMLDGTVPLGRRKSDETENTIDDLLREVQDLTARAA